MRRFPCAMISYHNYVARLVVYPTQAARYRLYGIRRAMVIGRHSRRFSQCTDGIVCPYLLLLAMARFSSPAEGAAMRPTPRPPPQPMRRSHQQLPRRQRRVLRPRVRLPLRPARQVRQPAPASPRRLPPPLRQHPPRVVPVRRPRRNEFHGCGRFRIRHRRNTPGWLGDDRLGHRRWHGRCRFQHGGRGSDASSPTRWGVSPSRGPPHGRSGSRPHG